MNNSSTIFLSVASLTYIIMLLIIYFSKSRIHTSENNIFRRLLFVSFFSLLAEIYITLLPADMSIFLFVISLKVYLVLCILWLSYFIEYVFIVSIREYSNMIISFIIIIINIIFIISSC